MYTLTEKRLAQITPILERYRSALFAKHEFQASDFERETRSCLKTGTKEMKSIAVQLLRHERFRDVAAFYMEHCNSAVGVPREFKSPLAKLYGIDHYNAAERQSKQELFWTDVLDCSERQIEGDEPVS